MKTWNDVLAYWSANNIKPLPRKVVCSAVKTKDGIVIAGARHHNCIQTIKEIGLSVSHDPDDQGFLDQFNVFMSREEALAVVQETGQPLREEAEHRLYSENLY